MKAHFFETKDLIFVICFISTFKLACDSIRNLKATIMQIIPHYMNETLVNGLNSRMRAEGVVTFVTTSVRTNDARSRKFICLYLELVYHLPKKIATDQAIAKLDEAILPYMQLSNMAPWQYAENLVAKASKVSDKYDRETLNDVFTNDVGTSLNYRL